MYLTVLERNSSKSQMCLEAFNFRHLKNGVGEYFSKALSCEVYPNFIVNFLMQF